MEFLMQTSIHRFHHSAPPRLASWARAIAVFTTVLAGLTQPNLVLFAAEPGPAASPATTLEAKKMAAAAWWLTSPGFDQLSKEQQTKINQIQQAVEHKYGPTFQLTPAQQADEQKEVLAAKMAVLTDAQIAKQPVFANLLRLRDYIGQGIYDPLPASLDGVVDAALVRGEKSMAIFLSPDSGKTVPQEVDHGLAADKREWVRANSDYAYLGAGKLRNPGGAALFSTATPVVLLEKPLKDARDDQNVAVLYVNGQLGVVSAAKARQLMDPRPPVGEESIVFVCDASGSMINKMPIVKDGLLAAISALGPNQSFEVIFFQDHKCDALNHGSLAAATVESKRRASKFLEGVTSTGTTDPTLAIEMAFKVQPKVIYLLTDGDFPNNDAVHAKINALNKGHGVKINTIALVGDGDTDTKFLDLLKGIAQESHGTFRHVKESDL